MSLSDLARALVSPSTPREDSALESSLATAQREARAELARALATLGQPARAFSSFTRSELTRGASLLRARVLRAAAPGEAPSRARPNGLFDAVMRSSGGEWDPSLAGGARQSPRASADSSWRAFVLLTRSDRTLLSLLYASAQAGSVDLQAVDDVARALLGLRQSEQAAHSPATPEATPSLPPTRASRPPASDDGEDLTQSHAPWLSRSDSYAPRAFGSASQFAARVVSSYRSLQPPAPPPSAPPPRASLPAPAASANGFSAAQALGLSALVSDLNGRMQVAPRTRSKRKLRDSDASGLRLTATEQELEREARRRVRWHELFRRRREQRRAQTQR